MAKKSKKKSFWKRIKYQLFGRVFNIWDILLLALIVPYIYMIWIGWTPETGLGRIYYHIIGPSASIGIFISVLIKSIQKKAKNSRKKIVG